MKEAFHEAVVAPVGNTRISDSMRQEFDKEVTVTLTDGKK